MLNAHICLFAYFQKQKNIANVISIVWNKLVPDYSVILNSVHKLVLQLQI
jgi:hypothetical protein